MQSQPTLIVEAIRAFIILASAFGVALTADQQAAIILAAGATLALISAGLAWYNRSKVYSIATTQKVATRAAITGSDDIGVPPGGIIVPEAPGG